MYVAQYKKSTHLKPYQIYQKGIARTFQDGKNFSQITVLDNLEIACNYSNPVDLFHVFFQRSALFKERKEVFKRIDHILESVHLKGKKHSFAQNLSYGQTKLIEILKIILSDSSLILLDEPFSGLFPEMIKIITDLIKNLVQENKTIILIEHNMKLIEEICDRVIVLDAGTKIAEGTFAEIRRDPIVVEAYLGK